MDIILNRSSLELKEKITFVGNSAIAAAQGDKMDVILPSKSRFYCAYNCLLNRIEIGKRDGVFILSQDDLLQ